VGQLAYVRVNSGFSEACEIGRHVRQGCFVSSLLLLGRIAGTYYVRTVDVPIVTNRVAWSVGLSVCVCQSVGWVCHTIEPCKNG